MTLKKNKLLSLQITTGSYKTFIDHIIELAGNRQSHYVCVANVHMLVEAHHHKEFATVVNNATLITPDGKPLTWALKFLYGLKQDRVAGMDILPDILAEASMQQIPVYFYGGRQDMLDHTKDFLLKNYPELKLAGLESPPFHALSPDEEAEAIQRINQSNAGIVMVILGCPKQEKWMASMKGRINAVMIGVGGALPVMIGQQKRAPRWMQRAGLEWSYRLAQEPRRLFKRYFTTNTAFLYLFFKAFIRARVLRKAI